MDVLSSAQLLCIVAIQSETVVAVVAVVVAVVVVAVVVAVVAVVAIQSETSTAY